jgi:hypothetical protein
MTMADTFILISKEVHLGRVEFEDENFPWNFGRFYPAEAFAAYAAGSPAYEDRDIQIWLSEDLSVIRKFCGEEEMGGHENAIVAEISVRGKRAYLTVGNRIQFTDEPFERK